jgi:1,4-dihydroxy-2-naphthoate polyprenyltransferase
MIDQSDSHRRFVVTLVSEILTLDPSVDLTIGKGSHSLSVQLPCVATEEGLACSVHASQEALATVRNDPHVEFAAGNAAGRFSAWGRAIVLGKAGDQDGVAVLFSEHGIETGEDRIAILLIPHEVTASGEGNAEVTTSFPFGGETGGKVAIWVQAMRPFAFTTSVTPILLGAVLAWFLPGSGAKLWVLFPVILLAGVLYHTGTNLVSDYYDYVRNIDRRDTMGGSRVLVEGLLAPRSLMIAGIAAFAVGTLLGCVMLYYRGLPLLAFGVIGLIGGFFYCGWPIHYKYRALGEPMVFLLMGPLMVLGSYYVLTGDLSWTVVMISLPVGFLVAAVLQANDIRDVEDDMASGISTASVIAGRRRAVLLYLAMVGGAYVSVGIMIVLTILPVWTLIVLLSLPLAIKVIRVVRKSSEGSDSASLAAIDAMTAQVHLAFGVLLIIGICLGALL